MGEEDGLDLLTRVPPRPPNAPRLGRAPGGLAGGEGGLLEETLGDSWKTRPLRDSLESPGRAPAGLTGDSEEGGEKTHEAPGRRVKESSDPWFKNCHLFMTCTIAFGKWAGVFSKST